MPPSISTERRATPPRPPALGPQQPTLATTRAAATTTRGLLWLGFIILIASIAHAGLHRAFIPNWWRQW